MEENDIFKMYLNKQNYKECINILENKIRNYIINLIHKKNSEYECVCILDLIYASNKYIESEDKYIAEKINFFSVDEEPIEKLERLIELCKTYNIR